MQAASILFEAMKDEPERTTNNPDPRNVAMSRALSRSQDVAPIYSNSSASCTDNKYHDACGTCIYYTCYTHESKVVNVIQSCLEVADYHTHQEHYPVL